MLVLLLSIVGKIALASLTNWLRFENSNAFARSTLINASFVIILFASGNVIDLRNERVISVFNNV